MTNFQSSPSVPLGPGEGCAGDCRASRSVEVELFFPMWLCAWRLLTPVFEDEEADAMGAVARLGVVGCVDRGLSSETVLISTHSFNRKHPFAIYSQCPLTRKGESRKYEGNYISFIAERLDSFSDS